MARFEASVSAAPSACIIQNAHCKRKIGIVLNFFMQNVIGPFCVSFSHSERLLPHSDHQRRSPSRTVKGRRTHPEPDAI